MQVRRRGVANTNMCSSLIYVLRPHPTQAPTPQPLLVVSYVKQAASPLLFLIYFPAGGRLASPPCSLLHRFYPSYYPNVLYTVPFKFSLCVSCALSLSCFLLLFLSPLPLHLGSKDCCAVRCSRVEEMRSAERSKLALPCCLGPGAPGLINDLEMCFVHR